MFRISDLLAPFTAALLTMAPVGDFALVLLLFAGIDVALAVIIARLIRSRRRTAEAAVVGLDGTIPLDLRRRTEPGLRSRRPAAVVEMQVRWRQAAEAHRRTRARS